MSNLDQVLHTVDAEIQAERELLIDLCRQLVAAPSASPPGRTVEVAQIVNSSMQVRSEQRPSPKIPTRPISWGTFAKE